MVNGGLWGVGAIGVASGKARDLGNDRGYRVVRSPRVLDGGFLGEALVSKAAASRTPYCAAEGIGISRRMGCGRDYAGRSEPRPYKGKIGGGAGWCGAGLFVAEGLGWFDAGGAVGGEGVGGYAD
jgi:hypothetical protein